MLCVVMLNNPFMLSVIMPSVVVPCEIIYNPIYFSSWFIEVYYALSKCDKKTKYFWILSCNLKLKSQVEVLKTFNSLKIFSERIFFSTKYLVCSLYLCRRIWNEMLGEMKWLFRRLVFPSPPNAWLWNVYLKIPLSQPSYPLPLSLSFQARCHSKKFEISWPPCA